MPGFSVVVTLLAGAGAWAARNLGGVAIGTGAILGAGLVVLGRMSGPAFVVPLGLVVAAVFLGGVIGRLIPPGPVPMAIVLGALAAADIWWIASGGGLGDGGIDGIATVSVSIGGPVSSIGTIDVLLAAAIAAHRAVRRGTVWPAILAAPIGMALANVYVAVTGAENLPLIPFIAVGWLATEPWHRRGASGTGVAG